MFLSPRAIASSGGPGERGNLAAPHPRSDSAIALQACECSVVVQCDDGATVALLRTGFGGLLVPLDRRGGAGISDYRVARRAPGRGFLVHDTNNDEVVTCDGPGDLLFCLDKRLTIALQRRRPDLYFLHAAAVALDGRVALLAAPAGTGKSTLALSLLQHGFDYLSDELAPVDVGRAMVYPYPRALCLKSPPPAPCAVPAGTLATGGRLHVPIDSLGGRFHTEPLPLAAIFFLNRGPGSLVSCQRTTTAAAVAHLTACGLNGLAHRGQGLDAAQELGATVPCYQLDSTSLDKARAAVEDVLSGATLHGEARPLDTDCLDS